MQIFKIVLVTERVQIKGQQTLCVDGLCYLLAATTLPDAALLSDYVFIRLWLN